MPKPCRLTVVLLVLSGICPNVFAGDPAKIDAFKQDIQHIVVIYQENWSFDGLYFGYPDSDKLLPDSPALKQRSRDGKLYTSLPAVVDSGLTDPRFRIGLPVSPFDCAQFIPADQRTGDLIHRFYQEQWQIDRDSQGHAQMDKYVAWTDAGALVMSHYDASTLPEGELAGEFTLCDHFFHAAFGGSFLNHILLVAAAPPKWPGWDKLAPEDRSHLASNADPTNFRDGQCTPDGYVVNTTLSTQSPHPNDKEPKYLLPPLDMPTIGDRLSDRLISWKWYSGGWNNAVAGDYGIAGPFQFHHQPFAYFANYAEGTVGRKDHLRDETDFYDDVAKNDLPAVSFVKFLGDNDEHPGYATLRAGQEHSANLVNLIRRSPLWDTTMVIITYDENGGRWDHVPPPYRDEWGPGTRVPTIVISPYAKRHHVEHTTYDSLSILRLIETRFDLQPLTGRENHFGDMLETMDFTQPNSTQPAGK